MSCESSRGSTTPSSSCPSCLARIEVGPLTRAEAVSWLGREDGVGREGATLAELYALRRGTSPTALPAYTR